MSRRRHERGQAAVEFGLVVGLFLVLLFPIIDAAFWALQSDSAVSATESGVEIAASVLGSDPTASMPATAAVFDDVAGTLRSAAFGTTLTHWAPAGGCPPPKEVAAHFGSSGTLNVCAELTTDTTGHQYATVRISGYARSLVPPAFGLAGWLGGGLVIDEQASMYVETFPNAA